MKRKSQHHWRVVLPLVFISLGCSDDPFQPGDELRGGILATFEVVDEEFNVWVTNPQTIEQILSLRDGGSLATIPNGVLREGRGAGDHNRPWSWHLDPQETVMAEQTVEVCSGKPSFVESDLDQWINVVGRYCPWSAVLIQVSDFR